MNPYTTNWILTSGLIFIGSTLCLKKQSILRKATWLDTCVLTPLPPLTVLSDGISTFKTFKLIYYYSRNPHHRGYDPWNTFITAIRYSQCCVTVLHYTLYCVTTNNRRHWNAAKWIGTLLLSIVVSDVQQ